MKETNLQDYGKLPLSLARAALTDADWRFLRIVHLAGGYVMRRQATGLHLGRSRTATQTRLQDLVRLRFLSPASLWTDPRLPQVYKLTARALGCLGTPNSHIRRPHTPPTVLHKLLGLQFIIEQQKAGGVRLALSGEKKRAWFEAQGFADERCRDRRAARSVVALWPAAPGARGTGRDLKRCPKRDQPPIPLLLSII